MRQSTRWATAVVVLAALHTPVAGQTVATGTRPLGGMFSRTSRGGADTTPSLRVVVDLGGGYDETVEPTGTSVPILVFSPQQGGRVANATGSLVYHQGSATRFVEASGSTYVSAASSGAGRIAGGGASATAATPLGRRNGLTASGSVSYDPTYLFNAFGSIAPDVEGGVVPGTRPTRGITEQRWLNTQGGMGLSRNWTARQNSNFLLNSQRREPVSGPGFDSWAHMATLRHVWNARERASLASTFGYTENVQRDEQSVQRTITSQTAELSATVSKPWSPRQRLQLTVSGGINQARSSTAGQGVSFTTPTMAGLARVDFSQTWSLALDARRDVTVLNGVTPEPFRSTAVSLRTVGAWGQRLQLSASASFSTGAAAVSSTGGFENVVGTAQVQFATTSWCAFFANYSYYNHRFRSVAVQPGVPTRYELNSVRAGVLLGFPLF